MHKITGLLNQNALGFRQLLFRGLINLRKTEVTQNNGGCLLELTPHLASGISAGCEHQPPGFHQHPASPNSSHTVALPSSPASSALSWTTPSQAALVVSSISPWAKSWPGLTMLGHRGLFPQQQVPETLRCCPEQLSNRFIFNSQPWIEEWKFSDFFVVGKELWSLYGSETMFSFQLYVWVNIISTVYSITKSHVGMSY